MKAWLEDDLPLQNRQVIFRCTSLEIPTRAGLLHLRMKPGQELRRPQKAPVVVGTDSWRRLDFLKKTLPRKEMFDLGDAHTHTHKFAT